MKKIQQQVVGDYRPGSHVFTFQGTCVERSGFFKKAGFQPQKTPDKPALRNSGLKFSSRSAKGLSILLAKLCYKNAAFLTLTHTSQCPQSPRHYKKIMDTRFRKAILRKFPQFSCVWRLEKQRNGEPHLHLITYGIPVTLENFVFLRDAWHTALDIPIAPRIEFTRLKSSTGAYLYLTGHHSKRSQTWEGESVGRYWGAMCRKNLPFLPARTAILSPEADYVLSIIFSKKEARRVAWYKAQKSVHVDPRCWELANNKLFDADPWPLLSRFCRLKKIKIFSKNS